MKYGEVLAKKYSPTASDACSGSLSLLDHITSQLKSRVDSLAECIKTGCGKETASYYSHGLLSIWDNVLSVPDLLFSQIWSVDSARLKASLANLLSVVQTAIKLATQLNSESLAFWLIHNAGPSDNSSTSGNINTASGKASVTAPSSNEKGEVQEKYEFKKNVEKMLGGNILVDSLDDEGGADGTEVSGAHGENSLVICFYLISRESGLLFQNLAKMCGHFHEKARVTPLDDGFLCELIQTFFEFLLVTKHPASIEKIALGLTQICKEFGGMSSASAVRVPLTANKLVDGVLRTLESNASPDTIRRSGGLPHALLSLVRADSDRTQAGLLPNVVKRLFVLARSREKTAPGVIIHALNIVKFAFQDSQISHSLQVFCGQALEIAILGFSSDEWSVRNSSLMLFTTVAKRMLSFKNETANPHGSAMNIVDFFRRAPNLLPLFLKEIQLFVQNEQVLSLQYPTLYPIALVLSKLDPIDLNSPEDSSTFKLSFFEFPPIFPSKIIENEETNAQTTKTNQNEEKDRLETPQNEGLLFVSSNELHQLQRLLIQCAQNKNFLGRTMTAKALIPFVPEKFLVTITTQLTSYSDISDVAKNHNKAHGELLAVMELLKKFIYSFEGQTASPQKLEILGILRKRLCGDLSFILTGSKCPPVTSTYLKIVRQFLAFGECEETSRLSQIVNQLLQKSLTSQTFGNRANPDFGEGIVIREMIKVLIGVRAKNKPTEGAFEFISSALKYIESNLTGFLQRGDFSQVLALLEGLSKHSEDFSERLGDQIVQSALEMAKTIVEKELKVECYLSCFFGAVNKFSKRNKERFLKDHFRDLLKLLNVLFVKKKTDGASAAADMLKPLVKSSGSYFAVCLELDPELLRKTYEPQYLDVILLVSHFSFGSSRVCRVDKTLHCNI